MGISITGLTSSGLKDFLVQRVTAVIILLFTIYMVAFFICHPHATYQVWHSLFSCIWMKIFTVLALLSVLAHAWVGIWTIFTDYIHCSVLRGFLQIIIILAFAACFIWGITILWGN